MTLDNAALPQVSVVVPVFNEQDNIGVRAQLLFKPSDALSITLSGDYSAQNPECCGTVFVRTGLTQRALARQYDALAALQNYQVVSRNAFDRLTDIDAPLSAGNKIGGVSARVKWDVGPGTFTSITAWRFWDWKPENDRDFTGASVVARSQNPSQQDQYSQEFRYNYEGDKIDFVAPKRRDEIGEKPAIPEVINKTAKRDVSRTYFTEEVKDYLLNGTDILGTNYQQRYNTLFRGGIKIFTTLDSSAQLAAEQAVRDQLPANKAGIAAAMVSLDVKTGAVRAMVGGPGFVAGQSEVNLALRRRQTGSSVKFFILAAALQAGVQPDDLIDGTLPCTLSNPGNLDEPFEITKGVSQPTASLRVMTWLSINCAYAKLSQIVGLERVVETMYRMSSSQWLSKETFAIQPYASLATGANELSPMDMASGAQTLANTGVHREPYMIERIEDARGTVLYQYQSASIEQTLPAEVAINAADVMRGVIEQGTARRTPLEDDRPAAGKTGTQDNNTNAWFVGFTPQYVTAVWVGDPKGYTKMTKRNVPEFASVIGDRGGVQGAMFPAAIWKSYMDEVHRGLEVLEFATPPAPVRSPLRLYLPGVECPAKIVSGTIPTPKQDAKTTTTAVGAETTIANTVVVSVLSPDTTISPTDLNPFSPVPTTEQGLYFYECAKPLPNYVQTTTGTP